MPHGDLVGIDYHIELDLSNLDQRLDEIQQTVDGLNGVDEEKVNDLIDSEISSRNLVSSDDVDVEDIERRVADLEDLPDRVDRLENAEVQDGALQALEERIEKLEGAKLQDPDEMTQWMAAVEDRVVMLENDRRRDASVIDLLRQLARALVG